MTEQIDQSIEGLVQQVRDRSLSRSGFVKTLTGMGASAAGIATFLASASTAGAAPIRTGVHGHRNSQRHKHLHVHHVQRQGAATQGPSAGTAVDPGSGAATFRAGMLAKIMADYADNAVVEDPLFDHPIVGKAAITQRKAAEMAAMAGVTIDVSNRFAYNNQVVAEWVVTGEHRGSFMGFAPTGRTIQIRGITVATRENDKIVKESLFYDIADLQQQLG